MSKKSIIVLGSGLVGGPMARDLAQEFNVSIADISKEALNRAIGNFPIKGIESDLSKKRQQSARSQSQKFFSEKSAKSSKS